MYIIVFSCVYIIVHTCTSLCSHVRHCTLTHTHRPSDLVSIGEMLMPPHGGKESKLKLPEKRKMSKRPYSYLAAMDTPTGEYLTRLLTSLFKLS